MGHPKLNACGPLPEQLATRELPISTLRTGTNVKELNAAILSPPPNCPEKCRVPSAGLRTLLPTHARKKHGGTCDRKSSFARKKDQNDICAGAVRATSTLKRKLSVLHIAET